MNSRRMIIEPVGSREETADRLLKTAMKHSLDPDTDVDWTAPAEPGLLYLPAERCSLYGTDLWNGLSQEQKIELSKHELASGFSVGIWTETMLMQMLLRHVYDEDGTSNHARHVFTEIAEECRHSMMFGKFMAVTGTPQYGHGRTVHELARLFKTINSTALTFAGALFVEEVGDQLQREIMADETVQPLARAVTKIHVVEEARHLRFAKDELARIIPEMSRIEKRYTEVLIGVMAYAVMKNFIHPAVYKSVGLDPRTTRRIARDNPYFQKTYRALGRKATGYFDDLGLITVLNRPVLRNAGMLS